MDLQDTAGDYFKKTRAKDWSIRQYFNDNRSTLRLANGFDTLCRSWVRALTSIAEKSSATKRKVAKRLLQSYTNKGEDWREARMMRAIVEAAPPTTTTPPSIVVNNSGDNAFNNATVSVTVPPVPSEQQLPAENSSKTQKRKRPAPRKQRCIATTPPMFIKRFAEAFGNMLDNEKWYLRSGVCVEDTLYDCFKDVTEECAVHSWVINTRDDCVQACFTTPDWKEICDAIPLLPDPNEKLVRSLQQFMSIKTLDGLQDYLDVSSTFGPAELASATPDERLGRRWVYSVIRCWAEMLADPTVFVRPHNENWYTCRFWTTALDKCISTIDGSYISRGETKSLSTSNRVNFRPPIAGKRRRVGHLYDGVISINTLEVGVVEHGRQFMGENGRKWCSDTLKVVKVLHDMLYQLQSHVDSPVALRQLQVVGIVTAEWRYQLLRMVYAKGHVCILWADETQKVPTNIAEFPSLFKLLVCFWKYRDQLDSSFRAVINYSALTSEQLMEQLLKPSGPPATKPPIIPRSVETDGDGDSGVDSDTDCASDRGGGGDG